MEENPFYTINSGSESEDDEVDNLRDDPDYVISSQEENAVPSAGTHDPPEFPANFLFVTTEDLFCLDGSKAAIKEENGREFVHILCNLDELNSCNIPSNLTKEILPNLGQSQLERFFNIKMWISTQLCIGKIPGIDTSKLCDEEKNYMKEKAVYSAQIQPAPFVDLTNIDPLVNDELREKKANRLNLENLETDSTDYINNLKSASTKKSTSDAVNDFVDVIKLINPKETKGILEMEPSVLNRYLEDYFKAVKKKNKENFLSSSLTTKWNSLRRFLRENDSPMNLKEDIAFAGARKVLEARKVELTAKGFGPGQKAALPVDRAVFSDLRASQKIGNTNPEALATKVVIDLMMQAGLRAQKELKAATVGDIEFGPPSGDMALPEYMTVNERLTKTRRGGAARDLKPRVYRNDEDPGGCPVRSMLFFIKKRPKEMGAPECPLFLGCKWFKKKDIDWKTVETWYLAQPMGINKIAQLLPAAAVKAGYNAKAMKISGTSARKTMLNNSYNSNVAPLFASQVAGQKNGGSAGSYAAPDSTNQEIISRITNAVSAGKKAVHFNEMSEKVNKELDNKIENIRESRGYSESLEEINPLLNQFLKAVLPRHM